MKEVEPELQRKALAYIRQHCMNVEQWEHTLIGDIHEEVAASARTQLDELPLVSCFISSNSWYLFSTKRVISRHQEKTAQILAPSIASKAFGNFKGQPPRSRNARAQLEMRSWRLCAVITADLAPWISSVRR